MIKRFARASRPLVLWLPLIVGALLPNDASAQSAAELREIGRLLHDMNRELEAVREQVAAAAEDGLIAEVRAAADAVYEVMWGVPSGRGGLEAGEREDVFVHGWKERWQTDETDFDSVYAIRYSGLPPTITNPRELGFLGRGRHLRKLLSAIVADSTAPEGLRLHGEHVVISVNNVIGWMQMETGRIKNEIQPRVDLTRIWDAPVAFWNSTADTGWAFEVLAQAVNILKVDYTDDEEARMHAAAMLPLIDRCIEGVDEDGNGRVGPQMMEGAIATAVQHAGLAGIEVRP